MSLNEGVSKKFYQNGAQPGRYVEFPGRQGLCNQVHYRFYHDTFWGSYMAADWNADFMSGQWSSVH